MSNNVSFIFKIVDRYSSVARKIAAVNETMKRKFNSVKNASKQFNTQLRKNMKTVSKFGKSVKDFGSSITAKVGAPLLALGGIALKQSANLESLGISFDVLIGNADKAKKTFDDLVQFTATTPFQLGNVANAGKQLLAFGVDADKLVPTLRMLGELAAGTGKPLEEFSLIFGKILAKGRVQGEEMLQLAEKGISLQTILAKKFGVSGQVISDAVSKGQVSFEMFNDVLKDVTGKGGKFHGLTNRLSGSLGGLASTLKDSTMLALKELGDVLVKETNLKQFIADLIVGINALTKKIAIFAKNNPKLTKFLLILAGILIILGPILLIVGQMIVAFAALTFVTSMLGTTIMGITWPILAVIAVVVLLGAAIYLLWTRWDQVVAGFKLAIQDLPGFFLFLLISIRSIFGSSLDSIQLLISDLIYNTITGFKNAVQQTKDFINGIGDQITNKINSVIDGIKNKISGLRDSVSSALGLSSDISTSVDLSQDISTKSQSRTDVNVNLSAPEGVINSIKSRTTGRQSGLNLGINMVDGT